MARFPALVGSVVLALAVAGCGGGGGRPAAEPPTASAKTAPGPRTWTVAADAPSTLATESFVFATYYPKIVRVRPGDSVVFTNRSSNDAHTVTFGVAGDRSDAPVPVTRTGQVNLAVFAPCATSAAPRQDLEACPSRAPSAATPPGLPPYTGSGYWNSGALLFAAASAAEGPKTVTLRLAPDIAPGRYPYVCLLHRFMGGTVEVVAPGTALTSPADVAALATTEIANDHKALSALAAPAVPPATVAAGWGGQVLTVDRFAPQTVTVNAGQTVTWTTPSAFMPHTVSFSAPFHGPVDPGALVPAGAASGSRYAGGVASSGIFGPAPEFPVHTFSLTFTKPGTYPYECILHAGMFGMVVVR